MMYQTLSLTNSELPVKVRFKACYLCQRGCATCSKKECKALGNYDLDGWRYDTIIKEVETTYIHKLYNTESNIVLIEDQCDFYTMLPPDEGPMAIL